ncbi:HAD-IIA family hydrolase [Aneurinibacillus sp. Ricciae_BoGa-3]|uniref:HAD-IIA family hydrolase n=1 Tax=Aneurinibacillus sp. Ricciae_BoGa-3 TaxID=3022697 RepID=UPI002340AD4C|nr:HAD-IIA family hydrolase [Aneurinibacillus sp. Ricciae_BoGa-3]WCK54320.1 HAD-IIA family hydrolase [Aneurinibacillus sp. Ricciae_BoGa-3]
MVQFTSFDAYFFDLDGTIFIGDKLLPHVQETLSYLRDQGKKIMFLTNTSTQTRHDCCERLQRLGVQSAVEEIITAPYIAGLYLQEFYPDANVMIIGERAIGEELSGFPVKQTQNPSEATHLLVGMDRAFTYHKLYTGMKAVRNGARLIAMNPDPYCPVDGDVIPDTWSIAKAIEAAGTTPIHAIMGKPSTYYAEKVLERLNLHSQRCLMVGDRLETDILFGINSGVKTALVLTGVAGPDDVKKLSIIPDYIISTMGDLCPEIKA